MTTPRDVTRPGHDGPRSTGRRTVHDDRLSVAREHLRCPFSTRSARLSELMTACPGFEAQQIRVAVQHDADAATVTACHHLQALPARQGRFVPACHHPETWVVEAARALIRTA